MTNEKAVEAGQLSQSAWSYSPQANVGYYEPHEPDDLTQKGRLYLIADAISGSASGQMASQYAIQKVLHNFYTSKATDFQEQLLSAIQQANTDILTQNNQNPNRRVMAITLMAAWIQSSKLLVANVGDNRAYVVWDQDIEPLDQEVSPAKAKAEEVENGKEPAIPLLPAKVEESAQPQPDEPAKTSSRERLPQALGLEPELKIQLFSRRLFAGDIVVLCTGGLSGYVEEAEIAKAVNRHSPEEAIKRLIALARERGNRDQVAISITKVLPDSIESRSPTPMALPKAPTWTSLNSSPKTNGADPASTKADPKASQAGAPAKTETQPLVAPKPAANSQQTSATERMTADPKLTKSFAEVFEAKKQRSRLYLMALGAVLLLCAGAFLSWRYLVPADMVASNPVLSAFAAIVPVSDDEPESDQAVGQAIELEQAAQSGEAQLPATEATPTLRANNEPAAENNSPIPTPEAAFVSPVGTPTPTPTRSIAQTGGAVGDEVVILPTPTPLPTIVLPANCENRGRFFRDVTVPDGTEFSPGESFDKAWLVTNAATCPWGPGYTLRFLEGDLMGADPVIQLTEVVQPDSNGEFSVPMVAPNEIGEYRGVWQLHDLDGEPFGPEMYLEIVVAPPDLSDIDDESVTTLYDFVNNASEATWSSGETTYTPQALSISENLELPPQGLVASGIAQLRGNEESEQNVLLTYPHTELGFIEGKYQIDTPLQPTDALVANLGFTKLSILSDDGVIFEVIFTPDDGSKSKVILSTNVQYRDSPVSNVLPLENIQPNQTGTFILRVLGGDSLSQDWAIWIDLRLVRQAS